MIKSRGPSTHGTQLKLSKCRRLKIVRQNKWVLKWFFWRVLSSPLVLLLGQTLIKLGSQPVPLPRIQKVKWLKVASLGEWMRSQGQDSATCRGNSRHLLLMETVQREPLGYPEEGGDGHCLQSPCKLRLAGFLWMYFSFYEEKNPPQSQ